MISTLCASGFCGLMWEQLMCRRLSLSVPNKPYQHIDCGQTNIERITAIAQHMHSKHVEHEFILHLQPAASSLGFCDHLLLLGHRQSKIFLFLLKVVAEPRHGVPEEGAENTNC